MIKSDERNILKSFLKDDYVDEVLKLLEDRNVVNRKGDPYSVSMIRNVLNGYDSNFDIKTALFDVYLEREKADNELRAKINLEPIKRFETKKSEAVTSDSQ